MTRNPFFHREPGHTNSSDVMAMNTVSESPPTPADTVGDALEGYAARGLFRGFARGPDRQGRTTYKMMWHHDRMFECILDQTKQSLRIPLLLPDVPADSSMYDAFKSYLKSRQSDELPDHRRIDKNRVQIRTYNRSGNVSITLKILDGDYEYGIRKLINLIHEIFLDFLSDGRYFDYLVEVLGLDPDQY